jgi:DNA-binding LytR/AlgR family response regulator
MRAVLMKVMLIDDESMALENLKHVIEKCNGIDVVGAFTDPLEALQKFADLKPDAVFLDIEMPQVNGFTLAEEMYGILPEICIVFVTGFDEYALKAFEINAVDYILKPVSKTRLDQAISKLVKNRGTNYENEQVKNRDRVIDTFLKKQINKIIVWKGEKILLLNPDEILCFYSSEGKVTVGTERGQFMVRNTLNYWEERLSGSNFFRCHRAFLINLDKVEMIRPMFNNTYDIKLSKYPHNIPVSRKYGKQLRNIIGL